jgi:segregation and condensation protein B
MDYFGINSADELPKIKEVINEQAEPTNLKNTLFGEKAKPEDPELLSVTETGELIVNKESGEGEED